MKKETIDYETYINEHRLNEMAQINIGETDPDGFPFNRYRLCVYGEKVNSTEIKYKHLHIVSKSGRWDIKFTFPDGKYYDYEIKGDGSFLNNISELEKRLQRWFPMKNKKFPDMTNLELVEMIWVMNNEQNF